MSKRSATRALKEEFLVTTETLWNNEINANKFVAVIMLATAALDGVFLLLALLNVFTINTPSLLSTLIQAFFMLAVPAIVSLILKGKQKWLKIVLLIFYALVFARLEMSLGHNVVLCLVFPTILSVRYYSAAVTAATSSLTLLLSGVAEYVGIALGEGRIDLNMVDLPAGTTIHVDQLTNLRDVIPTESLDPMVLWYHTLQHGYLPRILIFILVAVICVFIAGRGRKAIYAQKAETEKTQRLATELDLASEIQENILPNVFPVFPDRKEFSLYASMDPAKEVGGDFYDFFMIDDDHICLVMADVSGKGIPAALFMMVSRTIIKNIAQSGGTPGEILRGANDRLNEGNVADIFVTVWLAIIELSTGKGVAANAGHEHPALMRHGNKFELQIYRHSPAVAIMEGINFEEHEFQLEPGDCLFVYTDGVPEATNSSNELFGNERMLEALNCDPEAKPEQVLKNVRAGIDAFVKGAEQFDDITMLCLKYYGNVEKTEAEA